MRFMRLNVLTICCNSHPFFRRRLARIFAMKIRNRYKWYQRKAIGLKSDRIYLFNLCSQITPSALSDSRARAILNPLYLRFTIVQTNVNLSNPSVFCVCVCVVFYAPHHQCYYNIAQELGIKYVPRKRAYKFKPSQGEIRSKTTLLCQWWPYTFYGIRKYIPIPRDSTRNLHNKTKCIRWCGTMWWRLFGYRNSLVSFYAAAVTQQFK